ncbi:MAG: dienelactone hydrolase family protein, partial [Gemmatimonadaceae bacterium]
MSRRKKVFVASIALATASACTVQRMQPPVASSGQEAVLDDHMSHMTAEELHGPMVSDAQIDWTQQGHAGLPASNSTAAARLKASPRHSEWVKIAWEPGSKDSLMAWVVYPKSSGKAPVVIVVHEIFGLSTWVQSVADQVAAEGFIAIAPDLLSRVRGGPSTVTLTNDSAQRIVGGVNTTERNKGITAVANYGMMLQSAQQKYAVIGYCWGGQTVWAHAINEGVKGYSGGVAFYGAFPYNNPGTPATATTAAISGTVNADSMKKINKPLMLLSGSGDARIGASMPAIDSMMKSMGKDYYGKNYEGAIHGFLRAQDDAIPAP